VRLSPLESENHTGSDSMQTTATSNLVFKAFSSFKGFTELEKRPSHGGLYQVIAQTLISGFHTSQTLAVCVNKLVSAADNAYVARQFDIVGNVGQLLSTLPLSGGLESVARYYQALSLNRGTRGDTARAGSLFEQVADEAPSQYRARAMLALGANSFATSDHRRATYFYRDVMEIVARDHSFDPVTLCVAGRMTAVIRGIDGDHRGAVDDLERMFPLARMVSSLQAYAYYEYLNSLAVELGDVGRVEEARRISQIAVASPYARMYPEWRETLDEIESKTRRASRSIVGVSQAPSEERDSPTQILSWSDDHVRQSNSAPRRAIHSAKVISLQDWKNKLEKKSNQNKRKKPTAEEIRSMDFTEKQATITRFVYADEVSEEILDSILEVTSTPNADDRDGS